jgi:hypothetical protein
MQPSLAIHRQGWILDQQRFQIFLAYAVGTRDIRQVRAKALHGAVTTDDRWQIHRGKSGMTGAPFWPGMNHHLGGQERQRFNKYPTNTIASVVHQL